MFTEPLISITAIIVMIGGFIGLKAVSAKQRSIPHADLLGILLLVVIFICAGSLFWYEFLRDAITDKAELGKIQRANAYCAQAQGIADEVTARGSVAVIAVSTIEEDAINGMVETLKDNGFSSVEVRYIDNKKGGYTRLPDSSMMMPMLPQYSARDIDAAVKSIKPDVIICAATLPQTFGPNQTNFKKSDDMTDGGKIVFVAAGENQYPSTATKELLNRGYISYAVTLKAYLPQFDRLDDDPAEEFAEFYGIYGKGEVIPELIAD